MRVEPLDGINALIRQGCCKKVGSANQKEGPDQILNLPAPSSWTSQHSKLKILVYFLSPKHFVIAAQSETERFIDLFAISTEVC